jgi:oxygen-independent coproporphyrinogen-3 oxidase
MTMAATLGAFRHAIARDRPWSRHLAFLPALLARSGAADRHYTAALGAVAARPDDAMAIDVQLPFCPMRCSYCSSNVTVTHDAREIDAYVAALEVEIGRVADHLDGRREVVQLHFGGGTPNYLEVDQLERIMSALRSRFRLLPETEATIDCDPRRSCATQLEALRAMGFNHVRFGMADLQPDVQRAAGRMQSAALVRDACGTAADAGFETVGLDLLYGLPSQDERGLRDTLAQVIDMGIDRVRCHPYLHGPGEHRHQCAIDAGHLPDDADRTAMFRSAAQTLTDAGYAWIGLDHFVLDTDELALAQGSGELHCNVIGYSARPHAHVLGFGADAYGDVHGTSVRNEPRRETWQERVHAGALPVAQARRRSAKEMQCCEAIERLLCDRALRGLRRADLDAARERLAPFAEAGLVALCADGVEVTPQGRYALEQLCLALRQSPAEDLPGIRI